MIKCKACQAFYLFFATSLINSVTGAQMLGSIYHYDVEYTGPDSLVDKASASGAGGRRFGSQCRRHWGSF